MHDGDASGKRLRDILHEQEVLGARNDILTRYAPTVDDSLHVGEQLGHALRLAYDDMFVIAL